MNERNKYVSCPYVIHFPAEGYFQGDVWFRDVELLLKLVKVNVKRRKDTAELHLASRCTTKRNDKYKTSDGIAYGVFQFAATEKNSVRNRAIVLSLR